MQWLPILVSSLQISYRKPNNLQESELFLIGNRPIFQEQEIEPFWLPSLFPGTSIAANAGSLMLYSLHNLLITLDQEWLHIEVHRVYKHKFTHTYTHN